MIENLGNLKTTEIELRQELPVLECQRLIGRLLAVRGVATAHWVAKTRRLQVQYDPNRCGRAELVAFLARSFVHRASSEPTKCVAQRVV